MDTVVQLELTSCMSNDRLFWMRVAAVMPRFFTECIKNGGIIRCVCGMQKHRILSMLRQFLCEKTGAKYHIKLRHSNRITVRGLEDVMTTEHQQFRLSLRFYSERHVNCHLVAIKVGIERLTNEGRNSDRLALYQNRQKRLNPESVQRRRTVE